MKNNRKQEKEKDDNTSKKKKRKKGKTQKSERRKKGSAGRVTRERYVACERGVRRGKSSGAGREAGRNPE